MDVDITMLGIPQNYLARCGIYFSARLDSPFIYVTKEELSNVYPYRSLFYHGVFEYAEDWTQKDLAKKVGFLMNDYKLDFSSFNFYNGTFAVGNHSKFEPHEEINFKNNVNIVMKWQKKSALIRKLKKLDDLLR